jgi:hypothetical protein
MVSEKGDNSNLSDISISHVRDNKSKISYGENIFKSYYSDLSRSEGQVSLPFEKSIERSRFG